MDKHEKEQVAGLLAEVLMDVVVGFKLMIDGVDMLEKLAVNGDKEFEIALLSDVIGMTVDKVNDLLGIIVEVDNPQLTEFATKEIAKVVKGNESQVVIAMLLGGE